MAITMTKKDIELINTVKNLKVMSSSQIERLFYHHKQNQSRRCKQLVNHKKLKCFRNGFASENIYYYKRKPTQQLKSMLIVSEFYVRLVELSRNCDAIVKQFSREYSVQIDNCFTIRPDAYFIFQKDGIEFEFFLEVDNRKDFSGDKYYKAIKLGYTPPPIISVSNRKRQVYGNMEVLKIKLNLSDFDEVMTSYL